MVRSGCPRLAGGMQAILGSHLAMLFSSAMFRNGYQQVAEVRRRKNQPSKGRYTPKPEALATDRGKWVSLYLKTRSTLYTGKKAEMNFT